MWKELQISLSRALYKHVAICQYYVIFYSGIEKLLCPAQCYALCTEIAMGWGDGYKYKFVRLEDCLWNALNGVVG